jgi:hypothetical protein
MFLIQKLYCVTRPQWPGPLLLPLLRVLSEGGVRVCVQRRADSVIASPGDRLMGMVTAEHGVKVRVLVCRERRRRGNSDEFSSSGGGRLCGGWGWTHFKDRERSRRREVVASSRCGRRAEGGSTWLEGGRSADVAIEQRGQRAKGKEEVTHDLSLTRPVV